MWSPRTPSRWFSIKTVSHDDGMLNRSILRVVVRIHNWEQPNERYTDELGIQLSCDLTLGGLIKWLNLGCVGRWQILAAAFTSIIIFRHRERINEVIRFRWIHYLFFPIRWEVRQEVVSEPYPVYQSILRMHSKESLHTINAMQTRYFRHRGNFEKLKHGEGFSWVWTHCWGACKTGNFCSVLRKQWGQWW